MQHRDDIDGLRALAVIPVVLFHFSWISVAGIPIAKGGFVGVDIFFVISGYLISRIIFADMSAGKYSVVEFYTRRVKRIFPVLMVMYLVCLVASMFLSVDHEAAEIRNSVLASLFFVSNVNFASQAGYFGEALQNNPLLHTWSLSIEEQFYIFFPILLALLRRTSHGGRMAVLLIVTVASLVYSEYLTRTQPDLAYYSFLARAWELSIGSLLALASLPKPSKTVSEIVAAAGLIGVAGFVMFYDSLRPFPGLAAVIPCMGVAAIIYAGTGQTPWVARLLSLPPIRFTGLISYSLYIWHWPFIVLLRLNGQPSVKAKLLCLALCFLFSIFSWRFIELPFRKMRFSKDRLVFLKSAGAAMGAVSVFAVATVPVNAAIWPDSPSVHALSDFRQHYDFNSIMRTGVCFLNSGYNDMKFYKPERCLDVKPGQPNVLVLGDSHSAQYWRPMKDRYASVNVLQASASGCLPTFGNTGEHRCTDLWNYVVKDFLPTHKMDAIVLAARWSTGSVDDAISTAGKLTQFTDHVYLVGPNVEYASSFPRLLIKEQYKHSEGFLSDNRRTEPQDIDKSFLSRPMPANVTYVSFFKQLCHPECPAYAPDGDPLLFDDNHLTETAASELIEALPASFQR